jgi:fatty-acyl-CoA synthase
MIDPRLAGFGSLAEPLLDRAARRPDEPALVLIEDDGSESRLTIGELDRRAAAAAAALAGHGIAPGAVVLLALRHSVDLVAFLLGTLYHGGLPSILPYLPPGPNPARLGQQIEELVTRSGAKAVITLPALRSGLSGLLTPLECEVFAADDLGTGPADPEPPRPRTYGSGEAIAYLQYTSGTTGRQKGVLLSHRAVLNCIRSFARAVDIRPGDVVVNWLPLYHDYGLFAGLMLGLLTGLPVVLMSPFKWVRRPQALLWAIHRHRGTLSWMPNSAYSHTAQNVPESALAELDMSSLRVLGCAAEPILHQTQEEFLERYSCHGFREEALWTGFGMAENALAITIAPGRANVDWIDPVALRVERIARPAPAGGPGSRPMVSSGVPVEGVEVAVTDDEGRPLPERRSGEIVIRSRSLFSGYHRRPDLTAQAFRDGWFLTGDLGYLAEGQLYVCGRKKDLIIQAGHNIHPEDVEAAAAALPGVPDGGVAAFGVPDAKLGTERIILVVDFNRPLDPDEKLAVEREVRRRVFDDLSVTLGEVLLPERRWIVRTHNGKISRHACRAKYLAEHPDGA